MSMKTILVPTENDDAMRSALETALLLARRYDSYIEGFALRWRVNDLTGVDMMAVLPPERYNEDIAEVAKQARQIFESFMQEHNVPARPGRQCRWHSAGWMRRPRVLASSAATAAFST